MMKLNSPIRVLSLENQPVFHEGLRAIIASQSDMLLIAQASTASEAHKQFSLHRPDVTLMDVRLRDANGADVIADLHCERRSARIVVLTSAEGDAEIQRALEAGASAYLLKSTTKEELLRVIRSVHAGHRFVPPEIAKRLAEHIGYEAPTPRELDVLQLVREGSKNKQIAAHLRIAETTVNFHIANLLSKLQANDRTHAVTIAIRRGILQV
jgi:DNA-binding NarL/FixJ family response regulator